ncbi:hypothetical protein MRX96_035562 [Rhipicephalus microplus]
MPLVASMRSHLSNIKKPRFLQLRPPAHRQKLRFPTQQRQRSSVPGKSVVSFCDATARKLSLPGNGDTYTHTHCNLGSVGGGCCFCDDGNYTCNVLASDDVLISFSRQSRGAAVRAQSSVSIQSSEAGYSRNNTRPRRPGEPWVVTVRWLIRK